MKYFCLILFYSLFILVDVVQAQEEISISNDSLQENLLSDMDFDDLPLNVRVPYVYSFAADFTAGYSRNIYPYGNTIPDRGLSGRADNSGFDGDLRLSWYFSKHFGMFGALGIGNYGVRVYKIENALEDYYNGRYQYYSLERNFKEPYGPKNRKDYPDGGSNTLRFQLGAAYRIYYGRWCFRTLLGAGYHVFYPENTSLLRADHLSSNEIIPELVEIDFLKKKDGERLEGYSFPTLCYSPSIQINYSITSHLFASLEVSYVGNIGHYYERIKTYSLKEITHEEYMDDREGFLSFYIPWDKDAKPKDAIYYKKNNIISTEYHRVHPGQFLLFKIGVGVNFGHNKNERIFRRNSGWK